MRTRHRAAATLSLLAVAGLTTTPIAVATPAADRGDVTCHGTITGGTVRQVTVQARAGCTLDHVLVTGPVTVKALGSLRVSRSAVHGSITAGGPQVSGAGPEGGSRITLDRAVVTGDVIGRNLHGVLSMTRSTARSVTVEYARRFGSVVTLDRAAVARNVTVNGGTTSSFSATRVAVGGSLTADGFDTRIDRAFVRGSTTLSGVNVSACGSRLANLTVRGGPYDVILGDGRSCRGNTIRGDLNTGRPEYTLWAYNNTVHGHTTSPADGPTFTPDDVRGSGNRFLGGVAGCLSNLG